MMQLVRLWDQNVRKNFAEMMFAATTGRMGPVEDWAPPVCWRDDERENRRTPPVPDSPTLRTQEAVQQKHGTHFGRSLLLFRQGEPGSGDNAHEALVQFPLIIEDRLANL